MSDLVSTARNARQSLARGLAALQSDSSLPTALLDLATPIAQAMGALHQIESTEGAQLSPYAEVAQTHVRAALGGLQAHPSEHPALATALEAVASSLGLVHNLVQQVHIAETPAINAVTSVKKESSSNAPAKAAAAQPTPATQADAPLPKADHPNVVEAALGAHSPTNFYKGLAGNDIIDHGGLFVATYVIPKIGTSVRLKVSLPGGYEFEANAVVRWRRDQSDGGNEAPPGFGAQFTHITQEARQLVYRYVRNREPLFHDDL